MPVNVALSRRENLRVKIFVIGYPHQGESIVVLLMDCDTIIYSCVIDSFRNGSHNETIAILRQMNVDKLDTLCWSHPDYDHSLGIDTIIKEFCDENTIILVPMFVDGKSNDFIEFNAIDKPIIDNIVEVNRRSKSTFVYVGTCKYGRNEIVSLMLSDYPENVPFQIHALSPSTPRLNFKKFDNKKLKKNELSIVLCLTLADNKFLFCSDIEKEYIEHLNVDCLQYPIFLKIPHHSSSTSQRLLDLISFDKEQSYACSTKFKDKLPDMNILNQYVEKCTLVHYTASAPEEIFGSVEYTYVPFSVNEDGSLCATMSAVCHGSAREIKVPM